MDLPSEKERLAGLWQAVFQPAANLAQLALPDLHPGGTFHADNALVLAWLCQAVYKEDLKTRQATMSQTGLEEIAHYHTRKLHWSLVRSLRSPEHHIVAFRGTSDLQHWLFNLNTLLTTWPSGGKAHGGFVGAYKRICPGLGEALSEADPKHLWIAGHSLGGAFALFASLEHTAEAVYTFGCPRVGNPNFAKASESKTPIHRVVHNQDLVTTIPYEISFLNELAFKHTGSVAHLRQDFPITLGDETHLPRSRKSWRDALHAMLEGDHVGEPLPALLDHAPSRYVNVIQETAAL